MILSQSQMANRQFFLTHNHLFCLSSNCLILTIKKQNFKMNLFCKWFCTTENIKIAIQTCWTGTVSRGIWTHGESQLLVILKHHFVDESVLWRLSGGRNRTTFLSFDPRTDQDNGIQILCSRECFENLRCSVKSHHLSESKQVHLKLCMYLVLT